jgi:hypothetical protein
MAHRIPILSPQNASGPECIVIPVPDFVRFVRSWEQHTDVAVQTDLPETADAAVSTFSEDPVSILRRQRRKLGFKRACKFYYFLPKIIPYFPK